MILTKWMSVVQLWDIAQITVTDEKLKKCFLQYLLYSHIATVGLYSYSSCRIKGTPIAWMTWHLQYIFGYSSWCLPFWLHSFLYIPPLYLPKNCLQFGHLWVTEFKASMQQGTQAHGHNLKNTNMKHYERN